MIPDGFLQAILAAPDDDAPRLILADWLDEHGEPERAEFVRLGIALAQVGLYDCPTPVLRGRKFAHWPHERMRCGRCRFCKPQQRLQELLEAGRHTMEYRFPFASTIERGCSWTGSGPLFCFRRGFAAEVGTKADDWLARAAHYVRAAPLESVWLTDRSPMHRGLNRAWYRPEPDATLEIANTEAAGAAHPYLPEELFEFLDVGGGGAMRRGRGCVEYPSGEETEALSDACLRYGRIFLNPDLEFDYYADGVHVRLYHQQRQSALPAAPSYTFVGIWPTTAEARRGYARWFLENRSHLPAP